MEGSNYCPRASSHNMVSLFYLLFGQAGCDEDLWAGRAGGIPLPYQAVKVSKKYIELFLVLFVCCHLLKSMGNRGSQACYYANCLPHPDNAKHGVLNSDPPPYHHAAENTPRDPVRYCQRDVDYFM